MTIPLEALNPGNPMAGLKRAKEISSPTSFFKIGTCLERTLLRVVNASTLPSTIKILEPNEQAIKKSKSSFRKLLPGGNDILRVFKEFPIPVEASSIHFLKTGLCVGCAEGFGMVNLETMDIMSLLNSTDALLDFVRKGPRDKTPPTAIYRIEDHFLLCYDGEICILCG
ncbi:hypothetical protein M407DRAFT_30932 [Tulasnella calospora MUT 4182]|uniref:CNH domain-containing protein n=1 Tax=Tulasnella calospora MUT 4182 TaxID=1051891 RepID=A0A0C3Q7E1_9AGAM|nr:hypothetical protein M407DRAFT_30932 [Tulasnella calospora MUT 4182]